MSPFAIPVALGLLAPAGLPRDAGTVRHGLRVPRGFEVVEFADGKLADDIYCLTVDARGRVLVSGRGYLRVLLDDDGDGRADRAVEFAAGPKDGAMGLLWEGDSLYATGDGGLRRYRDADGDLKADGPSELLYKLTTGGEHSSHAVRRGPDGRLYVLCGDHSGVDRSFASSPTSPVRDPVGGCVLRFGEDLKTSEIVADGFRNAYGMDFTADGELVTFDSDNERCVALPWYEPTRFYHVREGGHYGWRGPQRAAWWRLPPYACDVVSPIAKLGRGSPTGVVCYRHLQFPERYRGGVFLLDWTFGRVWFVTLERRGSGYAGRAELFLEAVGDNGFAPTAAAVDPTTGDLYISIGGRGTRGAVYRIRYPDGLRRFTAAEIAAVQPKPRSLDWKPSLRDELPKQAAGGDPATRFTALRLLWRHREQFDARTLSAAVRATWGDGDRDVRRASADLLSTLDAATTRKLAAQARSPAEELTFSLATYRDDPVGAVSLAGTLLAAKDVHAEFRLDSARLLQLALGGLTAPAERGTVWAGYTPRAARLDPDQVAAVTAAVRAAFPSGNADLDRECSRLLAVVEADDAALTERVAARLTADSDPVEDFHYLIVLARLRGPRAGGVTARAAAALLQLDAKLTRRKLNRDTNWPLRLAELTDGLARRDPRLHAALLAHPDFGRPDHARFALAAGFDRRRAAEVFLARAAADDDYPWSPAAVELVGGIDDPRGRVALRRAWGRAGLDAAILPHLARRPDRADRDKFLSGLGAPQPAVALACLDALARLGGTYDGDALLALVRVLGGRGDSAEEKRLRERAAAELRRATGRDTPSADRDAWAAWFAGKYPELAPRLAGPDGVDSTAWARRLAKVDWKSGDGGRGREVFVKASCAGCHSGAQALGPDLAGVAGRFSRDDLFTAVVQPSKDVSPRYRTTVLTTDAGKVYQGLVVYEAADGVLLQTGPGQTVRVPGGQVAERRTSDVSLMPAGLLDKLADRDLADLYAYLRTLGGGAKPRRRGVTSSSQARRGSARRRRPRPGLRPA